MEARERRRAIEFKLVLGGNETVGVFRQRRGNPDVIDFKQLAEQARRGGPATIALKRGVDENLVLWKWRERAIEGGPEDARADGQIQILDYEGGPISTYRFIQAWPSKYTGAGARLDSPNDDGDVELIVLEYEGLERA